MLVYIMIILTLGVLTTVIGFSVVTTKLVSSEYHKNAICILLVLIALAALITCGLGIAAAKAAEDRAERARLRALEYELDRTTADILNSINR